MNKNTAQFTPEIRDRIAKGYMTSEHARIARALLSVGAVGDLDHAQESAKILLTGSPLTASHIVRNYGAGGLTYDMVNNAVKAAARAAAV